MAIAVAIPNEVNNKNILYLYSVYADTLNAAIKLKTKPTTSFLFILFKI